MRLLLAISLILWASQVHSAPSISTTIVHGSSIVVTGTAFGTKSPAAPLMWDDMEGETIGSFPRSTANSYSQVGYSDYQPADTREAEDIPDTHEINYRAINESPVSDAVPGAHDHSTKYLNAGHWENNVGLHSGRDIQVTIPSKTNYDAGVASAAGFEPFWYASWYYRVDPDWPACGNSPNHKMMVIQRDISAYGGATYTNDFNYHSYNNGTSPCLADATLLMRHFTDIGSCDDLTGEGDNEYVPNPRYGWVKFEDVIADDASLGQKVVRINNAIGWSCTNAGAWVTSAIGSSPGSYTVGGYYRQSLDGAGVQNNDAFRYFDDIYVDSTLSRVVLANNATYTDATIIEPQIPSAWSATEITAKVNQGGLPDGTAYLYVFDSDGDVSTGLAVTLGGSTSGSKFEQEGVTGFEQTGTTTWEQ